MEELIYRCQYKTCPHFAEPCEFTQNEIAVCLKSTICPIGEDENIGYLIDKTYEFFLLIVGSRDFTNYEKFKEVTDKLLAKPIKQGKRIVIVSGGANGADSLAEKYAEEKQYQMYIFPADWSKGNRAGYLRNEKMHTFIAKQYNRGVLAFWDGESKGTEHSFSLAKKYDNPLVMYNYISQKLYKQT